MLGITVRHYIAAIGPTVVSTALMAVVVFAISKLSGSLILRFTAEVACGGAAFAAAALVIQRRRLGVLAEFVRSIRNS